MDLRSRVGLWTVLVVYSLCYSNGILDYVGNSDATDNIANNMNEDLSGINTDNQYDTTTFGSSGKSTGDQIGTLDGESDEEPGIVTSDKNSSSVDSPIDITTEEHTNNKTNFLIGDLNPTFYDGTTAVTFSDSTNSPKPTDFFPDNSTYSLNPTDISSDTSTDSPRSTDISYDDSMFSIMQTTTSSNKSRDSTVSQNSTDLSSSNADDISTDKSTEISSIYSTSAFFNKDSETSTSKPVDDSVVISFESYLPEIERLCPGINVCGKTYNANGTTEINHCCLSCSCEPSCIDYQNCCYDNIVTDDQQEMVRCLIPVVGVYDNVNLGEMPSYRFVVAPPLDGCKTADDITIEKILDVDEKVSPWGDFYPVYSKSFDLNFKNEKIAICHGARDIEHWKPLAIYSGVHYKSGGQPMTHFFSKFNSIDVFIVFEPPRPEILHQDYICFQTTVGTCSIYFNTFDIPSYMQADRKGIVAACEQGPRALYWVSPTVSFKNVYCALCNALPSTLLDDGVYCRYGLEKRHFLYALVVLLSTDFIDAANIQGADLRDKASDQGCYRPEDNTNDVECRRLQCPMFQIRLADSQCGYPSAVLLINNIFVRLNLSTTDIIDTTFINKLTEADLHSLFQRLIPWKGCWVIERIGLRIETNTTEFYIQLECYAKQFELNKVNKGLRKLLSKTWVVLFNNRTIRFNQQLNIHGDTYTLGYQPEIRHTNFTPAWTADKTRNRSSDLSEKVIWNVLYLQTSMRSLYQLEINKLFFCYQIELRNSEYEIQYSILYFKKNNIHLYPNEFSLFRDGAGFERARICLEDSDYIAAGFVTMEMHLGFLVMVFLCRELLAT